jgi:alcohol dehydrogenase class IV
MSAFGFLAPEQTRIGRGAALTAAQEILGLGRRVALVRGKSVDWAGTLARDLQGAGAALEVLETRGEPTLSGLESLLEETRAFQADVIVAVGGGSVIDMGKALAALTPAPNGPLHYLEGVGAANPLEATPLPFAAIPTTSGTGAEATKNAVIDVTEARRKVSLRDPRMVPNLAIVDAALTDGCPRHVTLASGLDAVTQVIEPYLSARANPVTDALCASAIGPGLKALARLMDAEDAAAREEMARVSYLGGLALANAGLGAVHGLAGVLGGMTGGAHGAICGRLLAPVLDANRQALTLEGRDTTRFDHVERWVCEALPGYSGSASERLSAFAYAHGLPRLREMGLHDGDIAVVAETSAGASSMKANPIALAPAALETVLRVAL